MKRHIFLLLVTLITSCTFKKYQVEQPNFVIIYLDDVGYGDLGCYGALDIKTPRVDLMAKEGIRFTDFYTMPICGPSRATLMTGRYLQRQHGGTWLVPPNEFMLSEALKTVDYATACIGKWDMSHRRPVDGCIPNDQGFDYFFGTLGATIIALVNGAHVIRTHDVKPTKEAVKVAQTILNYIPQDFAP